MVSSAPGGQVSQLPAPRPVQEEWAQGVLLLGEESRGNADDRPEDPRWASPRLGSHSIFSVCSSRASSARGPGVARSVLELCLVLFCFVFELLGKAVLAS